MSERCFACGCTDCCGAGWQEMFGVDTPEKLKQQIAALGRTLPVAEREVVEAHERLLSEVVTVRDEARDAQRLLIPAADPTGDARMAYGIVADRLDAALARLREAAPPAAEREVVEVCHE